MVKETTELRGKYTYEINDVRKRSATHTLYLSTAVETGKRYNIKVLDQREYRLEQWLRREGSVLSTLQSPYIVQIHDIGQTTNGIFLVMEDVQGRLLPDWIETRNTVDEFTGLQFMRQMMLALKETESRGIVHRGISPSSIWVCPPIVVNDEVLVKLWDFGLATVQQPNQPGEPGDGFKRMGFWAPEQLAFDKAINKVDVRADMYGAAAVVYWMLSGKTPYEAESIARLIANITDPKTMPIGLVSLRPDLSKECTQLIDGCLAKAPTDRIASPTKLLKQLDALLANSDRLDYWVRHAERALQRASQTDNWGEVIDTCKTAEREKGGNIRVQEILRYARQMQEKTIAESLQNSIYLASDLIDRGSLDEADKEIRTLEMRSASYPQIAERLNLPDKLEVLRNLQRDRATFKPAYLYSDIENDPSTNGSQRSYELLRSRLRLGRHGQHEPIGSTTQDIDLINLGVELHGKSVSRTHAYLSFRMGGWFVQPNHAASNPVYVNDRVVVEEQELRNRDKLRLGNVRLIFCSELPESKANEAPDNKLPV